MLTARLRRSLFVRSVAFIATACAVATVSACSSDSLTQPDVTVRNSITSLTLAQLNALIAAASLTRDDAIPRGVVHSYTFSKKGGTIDMRKETGLRVDIPDGAIPGSTLTITVTALPGKSVAYDFQPHGTVFLKPLVFSQDLNNTSWDKLNFHGVVMGGYFKDATQVNLLTGLAQLDELFPVTISKKDVSFNIKHFSGYMVATGRMDASTADAPSEF